MDDYSKHYDFSKSIKFNYSNQPIISLFIENPLTKQMAFVENAIIDSGADTCVCSSVIAEK